MKKIFVFICVLLSKSTWAATMEDASPVTTTSTAIIPYMDLKTEVRTYLGIREPRSLYPWEVDKVLYKAASAGKNALLHRLLSPTNPLRLSRSNLIQALFMAIKKGHHEAAEILLTSPILTNLTNEDVRDFGNLPIGRSLPGFIDSKEDNEENRRLCLYLQTLPVRLPNILKRNRSNITGHALNIPVQGYQELSFILAAYQGFLGVLQLIPANVLSTFDPILLGGALNVSATEGHLEVYQYLKQFLDLSNVLNRETAFRAAAKIGDLVTLNTLPLLPEEKEHISLEVMREASLPAKRNTFFINAKGEITPLVYKDSPLTLEYVLSEESRFDISPAQIAEFLFVPHIGSTKFSVQTARVLVEKLAPHLSQMLTESENNRAGGFIGHRQFYYFLSSYLYYPSLQPLFTILLNSLTEENLLKLFDEVPAALVISTLENKGISYDTIRSSLKRHYSWYRYPSLIAQWPSAFFEAVMDLDLISHLTSCGSFEDSNELKRRIFGVLLSKIKDTSKREVALNSMLEHAAKFNSTPFFRELDATAHPSVYPTEVMIARAVGSNDLEAIKALYLKHPSLKKSFLNRAAIHGNFRSLAGIFNDNLEDPSIYTLRDWANTSLTYNHEDNLRYLEPKLPRRIETPGQQGIQKDISVVRAYLAAADGDLISLRNNIALGIIHGQIQHPGSKVIRKAVQNGHLHIVKYFTSENDEGLDPSWHAIEWDDNPWTTYITDTAEYNHAHILKHFLTHSETIENAKPAHIGEAMLVAAQNNSLECLSMLITFFEGHREFPAYAREAYKIAAYHGSEKAVGILRQYVPTSMQYKALPYAVKGGQIDLVKKLLKSIVRPGIELSRAALITAAHAGQWEILKILLTGNASHLLKDFVHEAEAKRKAERQAITEQQLWLYGF